MGRDRLVQVIVNLASNALAYGDPKDPITVVTRARGDEGVTLSVHNRGKPIDPALLPRIFEPLQRGTAASEAGLRSIGLGLYIVKEIVRAHGGTVAVRSTSDEGSTFTVELPRRG